MHEKNVDTMRGLEGIAAKEYFDAFKVILANTGWNWLGRSRRPAKDKVNALLNYGYAFLERETRLAIVAAITVKKTVWYLTLWSYFANQLLIDSL